VASGFPRGAALRSPITLRSQQGGVTADHHYTVVPAGAGSRVTLTADVHTRGAWTLAGPMIRAATRRTDSGQLDALDRELPPAEGADGGAGYGPPSW
jgi:hypothetical protein